MSRAVLRGRELAAEVERLERENAQLRERLRLLEWQEITPENLPKVGDELLGRRRNTVRTLWESYAPMSAMAEDFTYAGWTHFRPIAAPPKQEDRER